MMPKWTKIPDQFSVVRTRTWEEKMVKAIEIAWEALEYLSKGMASPLQHNRKIAREAMSRISALGVEKEAP